MDAGMEELYERLDPAALQRGDRVGLLAQAQFFQGGEIRPQRQ